MNITKYLQQWSASYKADLVDNIMPFWMEHGMDYKHGGVYTCLDRDGSLIDTTKSVWFQGRFGFIAAFAYNNIEKNPEWLAASKSCIDFIESQCYNLQEIKKKKTLMRRVLCGKLPERDTFAESILSRQTKEDHLGVAVNQPG